MPPRTVKVNVATKRSNSNSAEKCRDMHFDHHVGKKCFLSRRVAIVVCSSVRLAYAQSSNAAIT